MSRYLCIGLLLIVFCLCAESAQLRIARGNGQITLDGVLDEPVWQNVLKFELEYETRPGENVKPPVQTECLMFYDNDAIYVAFRAYDPDPSKIRAHYTDRDAAFQDDFVGVVLDTFNDDRRAFEFFVNPLGVQMDLFQDDVARVEDHTWDTIWDSAGKVNADGYTVEFLIPFRSLRFPRGSKEQTWGLDVVRMYPRGQRYRIGLNLQDRNKNCYLCQDSSLTGFQGITPGRNLELDPTFTSSSTQDREDVPEGDFKNDWSAEPGLTLSWGFTPNWNTNLTINPDFSQVEADVAQLDVNEQFALFFPEKRPFFLEGADFFATPLDTVFTRNVADPIAGAKLSGKQGKNVVAAFFAQDDITNILFPGSQADDSTSLDLNSSDAVIRYRRDIGNNSALGVLYTGREATGYHNRVLSVDGNFRFAESNQFRFQLIGSDTEYPLEVANEFDQPKDSFQDHALHLGYSHESRNWLGYFRYQDLGKDFRSDMGFKPQVDIRLYLAGAGHSWYGDDKNWFQRINVGGDFDQTEDQDGNLIEREGEAWFEWSGPKQSFFFVGPGIRERVFNGVSFDQKFLNFFFEQSPTGSFYYRVEGTLGNRVDFANTRNGDIVRVLPFVRYRFGNHLLFELRHVFESLDVEGGNLYQANLSEIKLVYQFNVRTFLRVITQYLNVDRNPALYIDPVESYEKNLFNQVLFSYKINPQTVLFLGYSDNHFGEENLDLTQTNRTVFLKVGYAWRL
ncbi:carbohydrate binding family 9 domain-containing protein [bacterium]|nr:carbohydrate binding family 9 domain-containing protein [bacterium]MCI0605401.1 carbohydrate binding family 9 domain-containing protein [bacterium]